MLAIVAASLAAKEIFRCESISAMQLGEMGIHPLLAHSSARADRPDRSIAT